MGMNLQAYLEVNNKAALAYSGGVDSAYLLYSALQAGIDITAYYVKSSFQPEYEFDDAMEFAKSIGAKIKVVNLDIMASKELVANPVNRCYYCKKLIFGAIMDAAKADGYEVIFDGTNASDAEGERPGMKALRELEVKSPLKECGLTKVDIRRLSKNAGLSTWNRPSYACLATRIGAGEQITEGKLSRIEFVEDFLARFGFVDFRIRTLGDIARIEIREAQVDMLLENKDAILEVMKQRFDKVVLDLDFRPDMEI